ncbi:MAG: hypothetical protein ABSF09_09395 [Candidatus Bathyarchaeia archaeon]|jgi:hypothetical protein
MPVTTFDVPKHLLSFIDDLVREAKARSRREIVVQALEIYVKLQCQDWNGPLILMDGVRKGLISKGSIQELVSGMSDKQLYDAGKRMGKTLRDLAIQRRLDISRPENYKAALQMLEDFGWGKFMIDEKQITITNAFLPAAVVHGYLEAALSTTLSKSYIVEDIIVLERIALPSLTLKESSQKSGP